ncbi:hypothetical protein SH528x_001510 [Novipirellula sp. SH528]|uniref:hypothetical protein n=1 Tax=Novipirellula sp. SH528 TaxID=3454466 RepID=UPI003FA08B19
MSEANFHTIDSSFPSSSGGDALQNEPVILAREARSQTSFLENFLNRFFQEKNIKWMLVMGAAIVFGSSLMLVTKAWPDWTLTLKYLTILAYTGVVFVAGNVARKRLQLNATYRVLYSLTLLLLPVCFLALTWLSPGTAMQEGWQVVEFAMLLLPATGLLWFASSRILDHFLRGRQTTFLISFCVLCVAGAIPSVSTPIAAMIFTAACWLVFTAGVLKVNRHTFWLAETHQLPRVFGFLPIVMLGLQFVVLVGTKTVTAIPIQWIGFGCVLVAATVLMTTRTVANVFRQRTGDLVRPLPWPIITPLFCGLILTILGVVLSFYGFSYVGETSYAVIPTSIVAAILMAATAKDTRHSGFVWISLFFVTIAYQCCPALFADIVQTLRSTTAEALKQERVPITLYGITYLPLLGLLTAASYRFRKLGQVEFSKPIQHFVTLVAVFLCAIATSDIVWGAFASPFLVSLANVVAFGVFAIAFADRRYVIVSLGCGMVSCVAAIPALNGMQWIDVSPIWIPTLMAAAAALMTATRIPDSILNRIPVAGTGSWMVQRSDGSDRNLTQVMGCFLAAIVSFVWVCDSIVHFVEPMSQASLMTFGLLMAAFVLYTLRNPQYHSGLCVWMLVSYAAVRWAAGLGISIADGLMYTTYLSIAISSVAYLFLRGTRSISKATSIGSLRNTLGFDAERFSTVSSSRPSSSGWMRRAQAFVVPIFDLSFVALSCLVIAVHVPLLLKAHLVLLGNPTAAMGTIELSTVLVSLWLLAVAVIQRSRLASGLASMILPLVATAVLISSGLNSPLVALPVVWAIVQAILWMSASYISNGTSPSPVAKVIQGVSVGWLFALLVASCMSFDVTARLVGLITLPVLWMQFRTHQERAISSLVAIVANVHVLLAAAALAGCRGWVIPSMMHGSIAVALPFVFVTAAISVILFDRAFQKLDSSPCRDWALALRVGMMILALLSFTKMHFDVVQIGAMTIGFAIVAVAEVLQAIRRQQEFRVWGACIVAATLALFLFHEGVITVGAGISQLVMSAIAITALTMDHLAANKTRWEITRRPMRLIGQTLPAVVAVLAAAREISGVFDESSTALNVMSLMLAAAVYFQQSIVKRQRGFAIAAAVIVNVALMLLWRVLGWTAPEFYMVPFGLSVLGGVELLKRELPAASHDPLRYIGALIILVSPLFDVLGGSWGHMFALMVLSVLVILAAIGLRLRSLMYAGSAFLIADLVAMVIRSTMDHPSLLWICGVALGAAVIALAAFCENHRENLISRIRVLSSELATWN